MHFGHQPRSGRRRRVDDLTGRVGLGRRGVRTNRSGGRYPVRPAQPLQPPDLLARQDVLAAQLARHEADLREVLDRLHLVVRAEQILAERDGAVIGEQSLIGAGALVTPGTLIPPGSLVLGAPAKVVRELSPAERANLRTPAEKYVLTSAYYLEHDINVSPLLRS